jgi:sulfoxide reductase heme-binding subunit YedZ
MSLPLATAAAANPALDPLTHGWWLASRASGIVALALITASTLLGLGMATKLLRRPGLAPKLAALHEQLAVTGLVAIGVHGVTLLGDPWLKPGLAGIALPGAIGYRPAFVAAGIVGGYLSALLGLSFYARRKVGARRWRSLHRFTVVAYVLALVHTLGAGTDSGAAWLRVPMLGSAALAAGLLALRLLRRPAPKRAPAPVRPASPPPHQRPAPPRLAPVGERS